jgi:uncharacterized protein (DUF2236 family)
MGRRITMNGKLPPVPHELPLGRDSVFWRVNAEPGIFAGGGRALLMQVAHPGVGAGVEQHSTYASDPWGRLFRTVDVMMKLSFASPEVSARQQRMLAKMHRRVKGTTDFGDPYDAFDVDLQIWVWATLVDTALVMYEQLRSPLLPDERDRYYAESKLMAYGCGVPRGACPGTWTDFQAHIARVVAEDLRVTDSARSVAVAAMVPPLPGKLADLAATPNQLVTIGFMPASLREQYGFEWNSHKERELERYLRVSRLVSSVTPAPLRHLGARIAVAQKKPLRVPWLQRHGAAATRRRLSEAGYDRGEAA